MNAEFANSNRDNTQAAFSIVLETENLASVNPEMLIASLDSLAAQTIPASHAKEVILIDSGDMPEGLKKRILGSYPWIKLFSVEAEVDYYSAKMKGFEHTRGDVVIFCDSDCQYQTAWLENLLAPFSGNTIEMVTGESATQVTGPYSLCIAMAWYFPPFSMKRELYPTDGYAANNVAFRRTLLLERPIPTGIGLYRGNCTLHARQLLKDGHKIWKQPASRAIHPTLKFSHFLTRFFMSGHNEIIAKRKAYETQESNAITRLLRDIVNGAGSVARRFANPIKRFPNLLRQHGVATIIYLPITVPLLAVAGIAMSLGVVVTITMPDLRMLGLARYLEDTEHA